MLNRVTNNISTQNECDEYPLIYLVIDSQGLKDRLKEVDPCELEFEIYGLYFNKQYLEFIDIYDRVTYQYLRDYIADVILND